MRFMSARMLLALTAGLLTAAAASAGTAQSDPAGYSTGFAEAPGRFSYPSPGRIARYTFAAKPHGSRGATVVRFTIVKVDRYMRLLRSCSSRFRLFRGKPTWLLHFPTLRPRAKAVKLCFRISSRAPLGRTLWLTTDTVATRGRLRNENLGVRVSGGAVQR